jgi:thiol-disulfide isomerase/thioredoxin
MNKRQNLKRLFIFHALLLVIAFVFIQYSVVTHEEEPVLITMTESDVKMPVVKGVLKERFVHYKTPELMPDFLFKTAFDKDMTFDDLKGQWVILNLWATWCPPCLVEMPSLQELQNKYGGQGVKVVAISLDRKMDGKKLRTFLSHQNFGPIAAYYGDGKAAMELFAMRGLPTTYILEPGGRAIGSISGDVDWIGEDVTTFINNLIK